MNHSIIILDSIPDKKIKSIGNRCLIPIRKNTNILDYHIQSAKKILKNAKIIVICGFESKKVKKYISLNNKYNNIKYIEYDINELSNFGQALQLGLSTAKNTSCLIWNTNHILHKYAINTIQSKIISKKSFIAYNRKKGDIGLLIDKNNIATNCYYDLPNTLYDIMYLTHQDLSTITDNLDISKLYLFEVLNYYIGSGISLDTLYINSKHITLINNIPNIQKVQKQLCST